MNDREQFEVWSKENWMYIDVKENASVIFQAGAESKQAELDKANARIAQMIESQDKRYNEFEHDSMIEARK